MIRPCLESWGIDQPTRPRQGLPRRWRGDPALHRVMARRYPLQRRTSPAPRLAEVLGGLGAEIRPCLDAWRGDILTSLATAPHQGLPRCTKAGAEIRPCLESWRGEPRTSPAPRRAEVPRGLGARPGAEIRPCLDAWRGDLRTSLAPAPHQGVPRCSGALARRSGLASTLGAEISAPAPRQGLPRCSGPWREAWLGDPALPRVMARRSPHKPRPSPAPRRADVLQGLGARPGAELRPCLDAWRGDPRTSLAPAPHQGVPRCSGPWRAAWRGDPRTSLAPAPHQGVPRCSGPWRAAWRGDPALPRRLVLRSPHQPRTKACRGAPGPLREAWLGDPALPRVMARRSPHKPRTSPARRRAEVLPGLGARPGAEIRRCLDAWCGDLRTSPAPRLAEVLRALGARLGSEISAQASHQPRTKACRRAPGPWRAAWRGDPAWPRRLVRRSPHQGLPRSSGPLARGLARRSGLASSHGKEISAQASHQREASARRSGLASTLGSKISAPRLAEVLRGPSAMLGAQMRPCLDAWRGDLPTSPASWRFTQSTRPV